jgi:hypothetical protein
MSALSIQPTYPIFTETDGLPLENGYIWIGTANLDPQGNPINVYWDAALTIAAPQPIRTLNGYPSRSGTPARLYVNSDYSIRVQDKNGSLIYSSPTATERYNDAVISGINAEDVLYDPPFAGAVQTNQEEVNSRYVSVKDFGAIGNGVANDTAALIAAETAADTELEVNAVCPGNCLTPINPTGKDTTRLCTETILWLALGRRGSSPGQRVHGGFFRYMKQISFENGRHLMDVVPDDCMRSWWDKIESGSEH